MSVRRSSSSFALATALLLAMPATAQGTQPQDAVAPVAAAEPRYAPMPDWVIERPMSGTASASPAGLQPLLIDMQGRLGRETRDNFVRSAVRIASPQGLAAATLTVPWQPDRQSLTIHRARLLRGEQTIDLLGGGQRFTVIRREGGLERANVSGVLTAFLQPEGVQVGDVLELAVTISDRASTIGLKPDVLFALPPATGIGEVSFRALWPQDLPIEVRGSGVFANTRPTRRDGMNEFALVVADAKPTPVPAGAPARFSLSNRIQLTPYRDWGELAGLFAPVFREASVLPPASTLSAEADRIAAADNDPRRRLVAALALVQDQVRYVADTLEERNYRPLAAEQSWVQRYGDCKAKTVMLLALLGRLGIQAEPVLVNSRMGDLAPDLLPTPLAFDHVVVRARIDGETYWLDGTRMGDRDIGMLRTFEFRSGLPLVAGADLERPADVPFSRPVNHWEIAVDATGGLGTPAPTTARAVLYGPQAQMWAFSLAAMTAEDRETALKSYWTDWRSEFEPTEVSHDHDAANGELVMRATGISRLAWRRQGARRLPALAFDRSVADWTPPFASEEATRDKAPYALFFPNHLTSRETITLPADGTEFEIDAEATDETVGGVEIRRIVRREGAVVVADSTFRPIRAELPEADAASARERIETLNKRPALIYAATYRPSAAERAAMAEAMPDVNALLAQGRTQLTSGAVDDALSSFREAVGADPTMADAWALRGLAHFWRGEFEDASADFDRTSSADPDNVVAFNGRALLAAYRGRTADAIAALERSAELEPSDDWTREMLLGFAELEGDWVRAGTLLDALETADAANADAYRWRRAVVKLRSGDREGAIDFADRTAGRDASRETLAAAQRLYRLAGDERAARRVADRIRAGLRDAPPETAEQRAFWAETIGDLDEAARAYDAMIAATPDRALAHNGRCWFRATWNRDLDGGLADCDRGLAISPDDGAILDSRALVLHRLGRHREAVTAFDHALDKAPMQSASLYGRGLARAALGERDAARRDLIGARSLQPDIVEIYERWGLAPPAGLMDPDER